MRWFGSLIVVAAIVAATTIAIVALRRQGWSANGLLSGVTAEPVVVPIETSPEEPEQDEVAPEAVPSDA
jgi:hypothetical protein